MTVKLPLLPIRDLVLFPWIIAPIFVGRVKSVAAINEIDKQPKDKKHILVVTQRNIDTEDPTEEDLPSIGVLAKVVQIIKLPNNTVKVLLEAEHRVKIKKVSDNGNYLEATYNVFPDEIIENLDEINDLVAEVIAKFGEYVRVNKKINPEVITSLSESRNPSYIVNIIASHLTNSTEQKQALLELDSLKQRSLKLIELISMDITKLDTESEIQAKVRKNIEKTQRDFYLNEQMKVIQKELEDGDDKSDLGVLQKKISTMKLSKEAKEKAESEFRKLKTMNPMASEASVVRGYIDTLLSLPWGKHDHKKISIIKAAEILDRDHYGLEKIKDRIVEYIGVLQRSKQVKGPILCLVGPPGVGKTSLVKSIAEAVGRKYAKISLGGVRDEAEIRGHRKTYIGSMPGKIINTLRKVQTSNPVILLDEIDKMSSDFRGDPASAMLEVLDPEQNLHFVDHYIEVEYDLSDVMFIATANSLNLPRPLLDRMEIINLGGYVEDEKLQIAKKYLILKQMKANAIKDGEFDITDKALLTLIRYYTRESGVRGLEKEIASLCRKSLRLLLADPKLKQITVDETKLGEMLGPRKYRFGLAENQDQVAATTGLAYTELGGDLLTIEAVALPGKGEIKATGKLGDVMKESMQAAFSYLHSRAKELNIKEGAFKEQDIHLHVPEGAVPKDGPSAGIAIFTTITSLLTNIPVRSDVAMTGEITLRGHVLPIGGLKEKLLAASRGGVKTVIIPAENEKDLHDVPKTIKEKLSIIPVSRAMEVLPIALQRNPLTTKPIQK